MNKTLLHISAIRSDGKQIQNWMELHLCLTYSSYINWKIPTTPAVNRSEKGDIKSRDKKMLAREDKSKILFYCKGQYKSKAITHVNWCLGLGSTLTRCPGFFSAYHLHCMVHHTGYDHTSQTHEVHPERLEIFLTLINFSTPPPPNNKNKDTFLRSWNKCIICKYIHIITNRGRN